MTIVNNTVNDCAMTVLPDAPIDPVTGLPVPTIAVATEGGVSVIKSDGSVVDITHTDASGSWAVDLYDDGYLGYNVAGFYHRRPIPVSDTQDGVRYTKKDDDVVFVHAQTPIGAYTGQTAYPPRANSNQNFKCLGRDAIGFSSGLTHIHQDEDSPTGALYAYTTARFFSGWMPGDIKGAFLSDTDDTDLVGGDLVTNGDFATDSDWTKGTGWTIGSGVASHAAGTGSDIEQAGVLVVGRRYKLSVDVTVVNVTGPIYVYDGSYTALAANAAVGSYEIEFTAATTDLRFRAGGPFDGSVDNISVITLDHDRSVNANGLIVNGTITRTFVDEV